MVKIFFEGNVPGLLSCQPSALHSLMVTVMFVCVPTREL